MRIIAILLFLFAIGVVSCKKESGSPPVPVLDSNFLKFTSSATYNGLLNYVGEMQENTLSKREIPSQYLTVEAGRQEFDVVSGTAHVATLLFQNLRHTTITQEVAANISWTDTSKSTLRTQKASLMLSYPNGIPGFLQVALRTLYVLAVVPFRGILMLLSQMKINPEKLLNLQKEPSM